MTQSTLAATARNLYIALALAVFFAPAAAQAAVHITDVMYDPPGADAGHEWIKVENTGTDTVNIAGYRLAEGGTNHKLSTVQGTSTLAAGAVAIIAEDTAQYLADNPSYKGALFKSSFSLSNTSETIALKDDKLEVVDSYSYTAPLVVKEPASKKSATKKSANKSASSKSLGSSYAADNQAAALPLSLPSLQLPAFSSAWTYGLGLVALLILGAGAALYARPQTLTTATNPEGEEFELE